jgi:nicotinamidase-related amidase
MELGLLSGDVGHLLEGLDPKRTAILAIHWQKGIVKPDDPFGTVFAPMVAQQGTLPRVQTLFGAARAAGTLIVHVNICNLDEITVNCPLYLHAASSGGLKCGSPEVEEVPELSHPDDISIDHHRASAFSDTNLAEILAERGIDTVVLTGVATNVAVESTARDASDRGYYVIMLSDCCVAGTVERHESSLRSLEVLVTKVTTSDEVITKLFRK